MSSDSWETHYAEEVFATGREPLVFLFQGEMVIWTDFGEGWYIDIFKNGERTATLSWVDVAGEDDDWKLTRYRVTENGQIRRTTVWLPDLEGRFLYEQHSGKG